MKMLVLGEFGKGALEFFYLDGFRRQNIEADTFNITEDYYKAISSSFVAKVWNKIMPSWYEKPINLRLLEFLKGRYYDVILVCKGLTLFPGTVKQLKSHARLVCCYNPDHPFEFYSPGSGNSNISGSIAFYDVYFTYARRIKAKLETKFGVKSHVIPFGYDDRAGTGNVSMVAGVEDKFLFIGSYDAERAKVLGKISDESLIIFGDQKWRTRTSAGSVANKNYQGRGLFNEEYKQAVHDGLGVLNLLREQNIREQSHNMRTFEVPGYRGLLIANRTEEQQEFFEEDKEAVYFDSVEELNDKLGYLKKRPEQIALMKEAAFKRAVGSGYSYYNRSKHMLQIIQSYL